MRDTRALDVQVKVAVERCANRNIRQGKPVPRQIPMLRENSVEEPEMPGTAGDTPLNSQLGPLRFRSAEIAPEDPIQKVRLKSGLRPVHPPIHEGSGASIAILASAADPRIKVLDVLDPWGDWPVWMTTSPFVPEEERADFVKPEFLKKVAPLDPLDWLPKIQAKTFRFRQNTFELDTPTAVKLKLRSAVPAGTSIVQYKDVPEFVKDFPHSTNLMWIEAGLKSLSATGAH